MCAAIFEALGRRVHDEWRLVDFESRRLAAIAYEALRDARLHERVTWDGLVDWVAESPLLPTQHDLSMEFGQPPLVVYAEPRFYIEALFWTTGTTAIHQHGFSGAFTVLTGSSVQTEYAFHVRERVNAHMVLGDLEFLRATVLRRGDVQPIHSGSDLIHSVFHLETPSVTVVVR